MKPCIQCEEQKELSDFPPRKKGAKDGHRNTCKKCKALNNVKWRAEQKLKKPEVLFSWPRPDYKVGL